MIAQVAKLASKADHLVPFETNTHESIDKKVRMRDLSGAMKDANAKWGSITQLRVSEESDQISQGEQVDANLDEVDGLSDVCLSAPNIEKESMKDVEPDSLASSNTDDGNDDSDVDSNEDDDVETGSGETETYENAPSGYSVASNLSKSTKNLKSLLDRWEEPVSSDKVSGKRLLRLSYFFASASNTHSYWATAMKTIDVSISDILSFRKRLSYMVCHFFSLSAMFRH